MIGKSNQKANEGVMISGPREPDVGRRNIGAMLLAAIGAAGIAGCASATGEELENVGESAAALADITIGWVDTVLGSPPSTSWLLRAGDLAINIGGSVPLQGAIVVIAKGCVTKGDGGGGMFYWDEDDLSTLDDGGTVIVPNLNPTHDPGHPVPARRGCWKRIYSGALNLAWFGANPTGAGVDNTVALFNALKVVTAAGGTIQVSHLYPVGHLDWEGISIGPGLDNSSYRILAAAHDVTIEGIMVGAGFTFMNVTSVAPDIYSVALKFGACERITIRNLTLDGSANHPEPPNTPLGIGFVYLRACKETVIEGCRFTNGAHSGGFSLGTEGGVGSRYENNLFSNHAGIKIGYINDNEHEDGAHILGNTILSGSGEHNEAGAAHTSMYVTVHNGVIANNRFRDITYAVALVILTGPYSSEATTNLVISGNAFFNCYSAIRQDSGGAGVVSMQNISITGNVCYGGGGAPDDYIDARSAIAMEPTRGLSITGNSIRNYTGTILQLNGCSNAVVSGNVIEWTTSESNFATGAINWSVSSNGDAQNVVIDGNVVIGYAYPISAGSNPTAVGATSGYRCSGLTISNNYLFCGGGGIQAIHIHPATHRVRIFNNRIESTGPTKKMLLESTCQLSNNTVQTIDLVSGPYDLNVTYYWEEELGRKTYRPDSAPPTVPPMGLTWRIGDLQYNGSDAALLPMLSVGDPVGWIYTGTTLGWRGFGVIV